MSKTVLMMVAIVTAASLWSCTRTVYEPAERVSTEREENVRWRVDTVIDRDTVSMMQRGDTIYTEVVKWRWRVKETHDIAYLERVDSIPVPYAVERRLGQWEQTKQDWGGMAMGVLAVGVGIVILWLGTKFRK